MRALPLLAIAMVACNTGGWDSDPLMFDSFANGGEGTISGRIVSEDMPHVGTFEDNTRQGWFYNYDGWVDLSMDSYGDYGWAMLMVSGDPESGDIDVIGCTGPDDGYAEFDEPAEDSEVEFHETDVHGEPATQMVRAPPPLPAPRRHS